MQKFFPLIFFGVLAFHASAQDFAPVGATWYFGWLTPFSPDIGYWNHQSVEELMFQGKLCRKLVKSGMPWCMPRPLTEYIYSENGIVYYWDASFNEFQILYNYNAPPGTSWTFKIMNYDNTIDVVTVFVNSISSVNVNNHLLKVLNVTFFHNYRPFQSSQIIWERIGNTGYMFFHINRYFWSCDLEFSSGIRCYDDNVLGFYHSNPAIPCTYINTAITNHHKSLVFHVFPNPATEEVFIRYGETITGRYQILNVTGYICMEGVLPDTETPVKISTLPNGVFILRVIGNSGDIGYQKLIKQ